MNVDKRHFNPTDSKITQIKGMIKDYKHLNGMLHIYKHKATYMNLTSRKESNDSSIKNNMKPKTYRSSCTSQQWSLITLNQNSRSKFLSEERLKRMSEIKKKIQEDKFNKMQMVKQIKETSRLIRDNLIIYKERIKEENRMKRNMMLTRHQISLNSTMNYKILKKQFIDSKFKEDIDKFATTNLMKLKEINSWRNKSLDNESTSRGIGNKQTSSDETKFPYTKSFRQTTFLTNLK